MKLVRASARGGEKSKWTVTADNIRGQLFAKAFNTRFRGRKPSTDAWPMISVKAGFVFRGSISSR